MGGGAHRVTPIPGAVWSQSRQFLPSPEGKSPPAAWKPGTTPTLTVTVLSLPARETGSLSLSRMQTRQPAPGQGDERSQHPSVLTPNLRAPASPPRLLVHCMNPHRFLQELAVSRNFSHDLAPCPRQAWDEFALRTSHKPDYSFLPHEPPHPRNKALEALAKPSAA